MTNERQLKSLTIKPDFSQVKVTFAEVITHEVAEDSDEENAVTTNEFSVTSANRPHKDLLDSMKKLRRFGLEILEIELADEAKGIKNWNVGTIKIIGDLLLKQSRVELTLTKAIDLTGKVAKIKTSQVTMYPSVDDAVKYHNADKMTAVIEDIVEEVWSFLNGKYDSEIDGQLPLFPDRQDNKTIQHPSSRKKLAQGAQA
jgi:hypothetical protein